MLMSAYFDFCPDIFVQGRSLKSIEHQIFPQSCSNICKGTCWHRENNTKYSYHRHFTDNHRLFTDNEGDRTTVYSTKMTTPSTCGESLNRNFQRTLALVNFLSERNLKKFPFWTLYRIIMNPGHESSQFQGTRGLESWTPTRRLSSKRALFRGST